MDASNEDASIGENSSHVFVGSRGKGGGGNGGGGDAGAGGAFSSSSSSLFTLVAVQDATKISSHDAPRGLAKPVSGENFAKGLENFNSVSDGNVQFFL